MSRKYQIVRLSVVALITALGGSALAMPGPIASNASQLCDGHGKDAPKDESSKSNGKNDKKDAPKDEPKPTEKAPS